MSLPVVVPVDASPIGIGVVLMQEGQLVAFSSTTLTMTQKRYCQIKKELLAVKLGLMRFRQYMYGRRVESDHKPLVAGQADSFVLTDDSTDAAPSTTV